MKTAKEILLIVFALVVVAVIGWALVVAVYKLLTLCFGWSFSWSVATGVWLLWRAARMLFGDKRKIHHD